MMVVIRNVDVTTSPQATGHALKDAQLTTTYQAPVDWLPILMILVAWLQTVTQTHHHQLNNQSSSTQEPIQVSQE